MENTQLAQPDNGLRERNLNQFPLGRVRQGAELVLKTEESADRAELETYIAEAFARSYGAKLSHFLPYMLGVRQDSDLAAVIGLQSAAGSNLFLEQYLGTRVEQEVSRAFNEPVSRNQIVEVGNLVSTTSGASVQLLATLALVLRTAGFRWTIFTATDQVVEILRRMQFSPRILCDADPDRLTDGQEDWGSYYANSPKVIAGDLAKAYEHVQCHAKLAKLATQFDGDICLYANALRTMSQ